MFRFGDPGGRSYGSVGTSNANLLSWWSYTIGGVVSVNSGGGRNGGSSLQLSTSIYSCQLTKNFDNQATWGVAFALSVNAIPVDTVVFSLQDAGTIQVTLQLNTDNTLSVTRNGTILGTSTFTITLNTYVHLEMKTTINSSTGTIELRANGTTIIGPLTSQNTQNTSNAYANMLQLAPNASNSGISLYYQFDDLIVYDGQTTDANGLTDINDFIGDCGLSWLVPNATGSTTSFSRGGTDTGANWSQLSEIPPDYNTTYVQDATVGDIETYAMADLPGGVTSVKSLAVVHLAEKTDVSNRVMNAVVRAGGINYEHATAIGLGINYLYTFLNWGENPNTSAGWTISDVNALEAGQRVAS